VQRLQVSSDVTRGFFSPGVLALLLLVPRADLRSNTSNGDPFAFFGPAVRITPEERSKLDEGEVIAKTLPAHGHELAIFTAGATTATPENLIDSVRAIVDLKQSAMVPEIGRFSTPPELSDLASLTLDDSDLKAIKRCRPGNCELKLSPAEISRLQSSQAPESEAWTRDTNSIFRQILFERVTGYLRQGQVAIPQYDTGDDEVDLAATFALLVQSSPYLRANLPQVADYFERYPALNVPRLESFLYWSKERPARNSIISVTHVTILRGQPLADTPEVIVTSKEIFATRYTSGALAMTVLIRSGVERSSRRYLAYLNRTWVDDLRGLWRPIVEWRIRNQAGKVFGEARHRIEVWNSKDR
jgi:hypothetical protein